MSEKKGKKKERLLLMPGASGWEVWQGGLEEELSLVQRSQEEEALALASLPAGELTMVFPVRDASALPFKTPSMDEGLVADLAEMHIERLGMRPATMSGVLTDCYQVAQAEEELVLLPVVLRPPSEESMPRRSPSSFDLSPRCLPLPENGVVVWKEFGRWIFAVSRGQQPLHFQALAGQVLGEEAGREIRLSLVQLQMQGLLGDLRNHALIWLEDEQPAPSEVMMRSFAEGFGGEVQVVDKPVPMFSEVPCQLLPADIRAERVARKKRRQLTALVSILIVSYLGLVGWGVTNLIMKEKEAAEAQAEAELLSPEVEDLVLHRSKWDELTPLTEYEHFPVELLYQVTRISPPKGLRFTQAEFSNQLSVSDRGSSELQRRITLNGKAAELEQVNNLSLALRQSDELSFYDWNTPEATETKDGLWSFNYTGNPKSAGIAN